MSRLIGPDDFNTNPDHSIEEGSDGDDEPGDITDEVQLERFIRVLQTAQLIAQRQEKEKAATRKRGKTYKKNAPRTMRRRRKAREEYQASGGKLITHWFKKKESRPLVCSQPVASESKRDPDMTPDG